MDKLIYSRAVLCGLVDPENIDLERVNKELDPYRINLSFIGSFYEIFYGNRKWVTTARTVHVAIKIIFHREGYHAK